MTGLHVLEVGQGPERLVFLHGLFGQGKNFGTVAKLLGEDATSVLVDPPEAMRTRWRSNAQSRSHWSLGRCW